MASNGVAFVAHQASQFGLRDSGNFLYRLLRLVCREMRTKYLSEQVEVARSCRLAPRFRVPEILRMHIPDAMLL